MKIGNKNFDFDDNYYIMGILNMTQDSFYDGGKYNTIDKALIHCEKLISDGADIIDVGGMSTRPGYSEIPIEQEIENVSNVILQLSKNFDVPISVDTYRYQVADIAISNGANMINDIWGLRYDNGQMANLVSKYNIPVCVMHNSKNLIERNVLYKIDQDFKISLKIAFDNGIDKNNIIFDPGIGFGKANNKNLEIIKNIYDFKVKYNLPILLGVSNKSFIGDTLNLNIEKRLYGSIASAIYGMLNGVSIFRVHNVKEHKQALDMICNIKEGDLHG